MAQRADPIQRNDDRRGEDRDRSEPRPARGDPCPQSADRDDDTRDREVGVATVRGHQSDEGEGREEERDPGEARERGAAGTPAIHRDDERGDDCARPDAPDPR